ncbi:MAG: prolyl oligopeptidase family serine peptidase, partial [Amphiplicatus sp.]
EALSKAGRGESWRQISPSWDGAYAAITTTISGDQSPGVSIIDAETGRILDDHTPDMLTTTSGSRYKVTWLPDNSGFIYPRLAPGAMDGPSAERLSRGRQALHKLGDSQSADMDIFGYGVVAGIDLAPEDLPSRTIASPNSSWILATIYRVAKDTGELWAAPIEHLGQPDAWRRIEADSSGFAQVLLDSDTVYAISRGGADRGELIALDLADPGAAWRVVEAERAGVMVSFSIARDAIYLVERLDGDMNLLRLTRSGGEAAEIPTPVASSLDLAPGNALMDGAYVSSSTLASAPDWRKISADGSALVEPGFDDGVGSDDDSDLLAEAVTVTARDGADIPVSILRLRSSTLDGSAPLLIEVYGSHGQATDPMKNLPMAAWARAGGVYAFAHVRGGGEKGDKWHKSARRETKRVSVSDAADAARGLVALGYGAKGKIALTGMSSGATVPGLMPAIEPGLFKALVFDVGQPDEIRGASLDPTAARNLAEYGDLDTPEGVRMLMKNSPYHSVPLSAALPAIIVKSASGDYNFGGEATAAKFVARLQAANAGEEPVIWMSTGGGHTSVFWSSPEEAAAAMAFILWRFGVADYQPEAEKQDAGEAGG